MATRDERDAVDLLSRQHRMIEDLFALVGEAEDAAAKEELFEELADQVAIHAKLEELHFYPALRSDDADDDLRDAVDEHLAIKRLLGELIDLDVMDEGFDGRLHQLRDHIERHVKDEEAVLFVRARMLLATDELVGLAEEMAATQAELVGQEAGHAEAAI